MSGRTHAVARWLAVLAIALQALWPLVAQAKPRAVALVPLCTVGGETHYVEVETGGADSAAHAEHCELCPLGATPLADARLPSAFQRFAFPPPVVGRTAAAGKPHFLPSGRPRAPPSLLAVEMTSDNQERIDEEAIAVRHRGARDAAAGRGVMRRGFLLD